MYLGRVKIQNTFLIEKKANHLHMVCRAKYGKPKFTALPKNEKKIFSQLLSRQVNIFGPNKVKLIHLNNTEEMAGDIHCVKV